MNNYNIQLSLIQKQVCIEMSEEYITNIFKEYTSITKDDQLIDINVKQVLEDIITEIEQYDYHEQRQQYYEEKEYELDNDYYNKYYENDCYDDNDKLYHFTNDYETYWDSIYG